MPQTAININPSAIKSQGILNDDIPKTCAFGVSVGFEFLPPMLSSVPVSSDASLKSDLGFGVDVAFLLTVGVGVGVFDLVGVGVFVGVDVGPNGVGVGVFVGVGALVAAGAVVGVGVGVAGGAEFAELSVELVLSTNEPVPFGILDHDLSSVVEPKLIESTTWSDSLFSSTPSPLLFKDTFVVCFLKTM